jgi:chemotaxis-related protein WspB
MLFIMFQLGTDRYAIEADQVVEVLPLVHTKQVPHSPPGIVGIFDYHGEPVPLLDLSELALGRPSRQWMSTRIILTRYRQKAGELHLLGVLAERATELLRRPESDFKEPGVAIDGAPYLGAVLTEAGGIVQRIEIGRLLPENVANQLCGVPAGST